MNLLTEIGCNGGKPNAMNETNGSNEKTRMGRRGWMDGRGRTRTDADERTRTADGRQFLRPLPPQQGPGGRGPHRGSAAAAKIEKQMGSGRLPVKKQNWLWTTARQEKKLASGGPPPRNKLASDGRPSKTHRPKLHFSNSRKCVVLLKNQCQKKIKKECFHLAWPSPVPAKMK